MKLQFITILFFVSLTGLAQEKKSFTLSGTITGKDDGYIYLQYPDADGKSKKDSSVIQNGKFAFKGQIQGPQFAYMSGNIAARSMDDPNNTTLFIEPVNMKIAVKYNAFKDAKLTGSVSHNDFMVLQSKRDKIQKRWKVIMDTLSAVNKRSNVAYQEMKDWVLKPYYAEMSEIDNDFLKTHPASYVSAYILFFSGGRIPKEKAVKIFERFPKEVKESVFGKMQTEKWAKQKLGSPGSMAANFSATDINGQPLSLSDYKGKYVLLDFWASWCVPCRKGNPHLLTLYSKYKDKGFEIIGVSDDDTKQDAWRAAVEKDGIGVWKHILRGLDVERVKRGDYKNHPNEISDSRYGISSLPTKILIDPSGKIIGRYGDEGGEEEEDMDKKLEEIFK
jgi:thiol-disulfide isomerase/thioredoxin